ncbi:ribosome biogenesis/translation initiation ATPase RLI [Candidatus Woesearchaeota archaeon]|nr:ribosome biogenesis/translation initiation ATPase RLI [Candidatus Woesearchaeota archaeon]
MTRIAVIDNTKLKDMDKKKHIQSLCPVNRRGEECIYFQGEKLFIAESLCIGCGICSNTAPEAIHIINLPEALKEEPIHRYGQNEFALYSLPTPIFGKVVGVIGKNGIGKSTAIKVFAGVLKPNLGNHSKEAGYDDLIQFFKGTESQLFFDKMKKGEIKVSYKPQKVDDIPKVFSGTVRELLKKVDDKNKLDEITEKLDLKKVLENDVKKISGGELQRVAIAACVLRDANLYIFDEPTSYLDIKQRLNAAKFIRELADEKTSVLVVEHDLIILDYMTDLIHIMYGKPGAYGIVSQPKATRTGMNVYLSGYLKEENVRFRDKKIEFHLRPPFSKKKLTTLTEWKNLKKKLGNFELRAEEGGLHKQNVVGVLGENGIGKTTFVRILAGADEKDSGEITQKIKVSYKPQYLETGSVPVIAVLKDAMQHKELMTPLQIEPLLYKNLNELSGGELQRVAITRCLSTEADLFLLDEPSAYLDAEQRLVVSKVIRDFMELKDKTALVVDHDLLFVDYLSDELVVFTGEPAVEGDVNGPYPMEEGMNMFLHDIGLTFRRDDESHRPRANKPGSQMDRKQRSEGKLYY